MQFAEVNPDSPVSYPTQPNMTGGIVPPIYRQNSMPAGVDPLDSQKIKLSNESIRQQKDRQFSIQQALNALSANPNKTAEDYAFVMNKFPELAATIKASYDLIGNEKKDKEVKTLADMYGALGSGNMISARSALMNHMHDANKSGDDTAYRAAYNMLQTLETDPAKAHTMAGLGLSAAMGHEGFSNAFNAISNAELQNKTLQNNTDNQASELDFNREKLAQETVLKRDMIAAKTGRQLTLKGNAAKLRDSMALESVSAQNRSSGMADLATRFADAAKTDLGKGIIAKGIEGLKTFLGGENEITSLRNEYIRVRAQGIIDSLPKGAASDKDIEFASQGFLKPTANPEEIASFLRGMSKIYRYEALTKDAGSSWISLHGGLRPADKDVIISGVAIKAGETYLDFQKRLISNIVEQDKKKAEELKKAQQPQATPIVGGAPSSSEPSYLQYIK